MRIFLWSFQFYFVDVSRSPSQNKNFLICRLVIVVLLKTFLKVALFPMDVFVGSSLLGIWRPFFFSLSFIYHIPLFLYNRSVKNSCPVFDTTPAYLFYIMSSRGFIIALPGSGLSGGESFPFVRLGHLVSPPDGLPSMQERRLGASTATRKTALNQVSALTNQPSTSSPNIYLPLPHVARRRSFIPHVARASMFVRSCRYCCCCCFCLVRTYYHNHHNHFPPSPNLRLWVSFSSLWIIFCGGCLSSGTTTL